MKLFRKPKSKFCWYNFSVRGQRFRGSTQETKSTKAVKVASLKLARAVDGLDPVPSRAVPLAEISRRFLDWLEDVRLEDKTKTYYRDGWRLLKATTITDMRLDQITGDTVERLKFSGSPSNANCALRTLRRMLHKAEEWKLIQYAPKIKLMKEHGRCLRLDDEAEKKLLAAASECKWRKRSRELFRDIVILMRDTGMRNERELYRMRIENLDWENRLIFVPDSKTTEGRRLVPMSNRVFAYPNRLSTSLRFPFACLANKRRKVVITLITSATPTTLSMMFTEKPPRHRAAFVRCYPPLQSPWAPFPFTR